MDNNGYMCWNTQGQTLTECELFDSITDYRRSHYQTGQVCAYLGLT